MEWMNSNDYVSILNQIKDKSKVDIYGGDIDDKVLLIDGLNTFIRVFSVFPSTNENGIHVGGIVGFLRSIGYAIRMLAPTRVVIVFDGKGGSVRRRKFYPEYKNRRRGAIRVNRSEGLESKNEKLNMITQLKRLLNYLELLPVSIVSADNIEADDVIAYYVKNKFKKSIIMSTDKDFLQLVSDTIKIWSPVRKKLYDVDAIVDEYKIHPKNFIYYKILDGDKSDNIKGVPRFGLKTIIKKFPELIDKEDYTLDKLKVKLTEHAELIDRNYKLMQLENVDISGTTKVKLLNHLDNNKPQLQKYNFEKLFMEDRLFTNLPNIDSWLNQHFLKLDGYIKK
jgi:DNA polymerase-1